MRLGPVTLPVITLRLVALVGAMALVAAVFAATRASSDDVEPGQVAGLTRSDVEADLAEGGSVAMPTTLPSGYTHATSNGSSGAQGSIDTRTYLFSTSSFGREVWVCTTTRPDYESCPRGRRHIDLRHDSLTVRLAFHGSPNQVQAAMRAWRDVTFTESLDLAWLPQD